MLFVYVYCSPQSKENIGTVIFNSIGGALTTFMIVLTAKTPNYFQEVD